MYTSGISANALLTLFSAHNARALEPAPVAQSTAKSAAAPTILPPPASLAPLSLETLLSLQGDETDPAPASIEAPSAEEFFLEEARKSPIQRMREQLLEELGLNEASLAQLPPEERRAIEDHIRKAIEEKFRQANGAQDGATDSNTAMLSALA